MNQRLQRAHDAIVESIWDEQVSTWERGKITPAEVFLERYSEVAEQVSFAMDVIFNEYAILSGDSGACHRPDDYYARFPKLELHLRKQFALFDAVNEVSIDSYALDAGIANAIQTGSTHLNPKADKQSVEDRFEFRRELGRGATAIVYEAWDRKLQQAVAVKKPHQHVLQSARAKARLVREARSAACLHHPGIVPFREICESDDCFLLISPLINGPNLQERFTNGRPEFSQAIEWVRQIADALHYAHENRIIHRDVKPSNVLINGDNQAMLTDFGLATGTEACLSITQTGDLIGTPAFMSPEQARGNAEKIDNRTDIYSLGALFYFLLSGRLPYEGSFSSVLHQLANDSPERLRHIDPSIPRELEFICGKCLNKAPGDRYETARQLSDDLRRYQDGDPIHAKATGSFERISKFARRRPGVVAAIAGFATLIVFSAGALFQLSNVTGQRNRAQFAEKNNEMLLAEASNDAGRLAMQRGRLETAAKHFETSLARTNSPTLSTNLHLSLAECYLALGRLEQATQQIQLAAKNPTEEVSPAIDYWKAEIAANGVSVFGEPFDIMKNSDFSMLAPAKQSFLEGLKAENSEAALSRFVEAVKLDPYHHSARKMSLIMALSLGRFAEVNEYANIARQLYPEDIDFQLLDALAHAAQDQIEISEKIVKGSNLNNDQQGSWIRFCEFLRYTTHGFKSDRGMSKTDLNTIAGLISEFLVEFQPLVVERRWRFPQRIGEEVSTFANLVNDANDFEATRMLSKRIAEIHPEGTLFLVAADCAVTHGETIEQLECARDYFWSATEIPGFIQDSKQDAWLGVYTMAMNLAIIKQHDVEKNTEQFVEACEKIDPKNISDPRYHAAIVKTLTIKERWEVASPFAERWVTTEKNGNKRLAAYWHQAVIFQKTGRWVELLKTCNYVDEHLQIEIESCAESRQKEWINIRKNATNMLGEIIRRN